MEAIEKANNGLKNAIDEVKSLIEIKMRANTEFTQYIDLQKESRDILMIKWVAEEVQAGRIVLNPRPA